MSAEFSTYLAVKGTKEECTAILKVLHSYADDRIEQYRKTRDCWYLDGELGEISDKTASALMKKGIMRVVFGGPYGVMNGPVSEEVDLFERVADAAPECSFEGNISGWDPGAEQGIDAKLENGLLYLRYIYKEFGEDEWDEDDEDEWDEDEGEGEDKDEVKEGWDVIYDPGTHEYKKVVEQNKDDLVTVTIKLTDVKGRTYQLLLPSEDIWNPTNLKCFPRDFLQADTADKLIALLLHAVDGEGRQKRKEEIRAWKDKIPADGFAALELKKVHDHEDPLFFGWLRSSALGEENNLKKPAKKVCAGAEKNKQKNLAEFEKAVLSFVPGFPGCEWTGWPEFCVGRAKGELDPAEQESQFRELERDQNRKHTTSLDWHGVACDLEGFARFLCSKEEPREYAVETVRIDYLAHTTEQFAVYMPGGPAPKCANQEEQEQMGDAKAPEISAGADVSNEVCTGLTFVITGKVHIFENRDAFIDYVEKHGGKVSGSVSKKTSYLVNNDVNSESSKNQKAKALGIPIISEDQFAELFGRP